MGPAVGVEIDPITRQPLGTDVVWVIYDHIDGTQHASPKAEFDLWPTRWGWPGGNSLFPVHPKGRKRFVVIPAGDVPLCWKET